MASVLDVHNDRLAWGLHDEHVSPVTLRVTKLWARSQAHNYTIFLDFATDAFQSRMKLADDRAVTDCKGVLEVIEKVVVADNFADFCRLEEQSFLDVLITL
jgi:hypothetical protein